ncbi:hypothetical protein [Aquabacter spiritensis]|uniref:Uncharacterized protein n=1 Tax=Aquabacter spiritensis TaxID=933073 RepID=A0A4R3M051_9HYPH|nr:hypothetical protein [Aquabacter spiritensis]TCT05539.1 hypothetical protein EDC64_10496 [Aquabacter spiritensis]
MGRLRHRIAPALRFLRKGGVHVALGLGFAGLGLPALAVELPFSPDCTRVTTIDVAPPHTGIVFRKNPNSVSTRAATATVHRIDGVKMITLAPNVVSCFHPVEESDKYCFMSSTDPGAFAAVNAVPDTNRMHLFLCQ